MQQQSKPARTPEEQAQLDQTRETINRLLASNVLHVHEMQQAALRLREKRKNLSPESQAEVQAILDACDNLLRQMDSVAKTVEEGTR